jgi:carbamoyltransferase
MTILAISCYYHDASACLVRNGKILAGAHEERFTRIKHDNSFPRHAIGFCLSYTGLRITDIDEVVFYEKPVLKFERIVKQHLAAFPFSAKIFTENIGSWLDYKLNIEKTIRKETGYGGPVRYAVHHLSHAAGAYYLSGFQSAVIITVDGVGEWATATMGVGKANEVKIDQEIRFPHSLGLLYSTITAYLGFEVNDAEYKVMGMAAYGNPGPFRPVFDKLITLNSDGSFFLNMNYFTFTRSDRMYNRKLEHLFGLPSRPRESGLQKDYADIAAALQQVLEEAVFAMVKAAYRRYRLPNLCLSGGVALNSVMNGKLLARTHFQKIYIPPDPGDGGAALGAALLRARERGDKIDYLSFFPAIGPDYTDTQIEFTLKLTGLSYVRVPERKRFIRLVAGYLTRQKVVGWFQGRMEWGPRALGNRSILASAAKLKMKDLINAKIKHRELFRPFAPVVLDRYVKDYFVTDKFLSESLKYMLMVYPFRDKGKKEVPATVHVDGSGRLQVITRENNPLYYDLIDAFRKKTGTPIILNTSFNVRGEPIVCSPRDAVDCFLKTDIDYLAIGSYIVSKKI